MITILTATYNSELFIKNLLKSLENQTCNDFKLLIVDNNSSDKTVSIVLSSKIESKIISEKDCGIYYAINKGIQIIDTDYYIVCGSDDYLEPTCIAEVIDAAKESSFDFITWNVSHGKKIIKPKSGSLFHHGARAAFASHSAGMAIKTKIHHTLGPYKTFYKICSDQELILRAHKHNMSFHHINKVLGTFSPGGLSTKKKTTHLQHMKSSYYHKTFIHLFIEK